MQLNIAIARSTRTTVWLWSCIYTVSQKTSYLWLAITLTHVNWFWYFFGRNVTDKAGNQKMLYYLTTNNLCFCTMRQNKETRKSHFSLKCCISRERCSGWTVLHAPCTSALSITERRIVICLWCVWCPLHIVEIVRYPINTVHWLSRRLDEEQLPSFTQRPTPWQTWLT